MTRTTTGADLTAQTDTPSFDASAYAALADVAAAVADCPSVMVVGGPDDEPVFNGAASAEDRDALTRCAALLADCPPLEVSDLHEGSAHAHAQKLAVAASSLRFCVVLPLHGPDGRRVATLCITQRTVRKLTPAQRAGLVALTALTPSPSPSPAQTTSDDPLCDLLTDIVDRENARRLRLSKDLHNRSLQWLAAARGALAQASDGPSAVTRAEALQLCRTLVDDSIEQLRALQFELYPPLLRDFGLPAALRWLAERAQEEHGLQCEVIVPAELPPLAPTLSGFLYFAIRELWIRSATRRHARRSVVNLTCRGDTLEIQLRDDGTSDDASQKSGRRLHRLDTYLRHKGGTLDMRAAKSGGQVIALGIPLAIIEDDARTAAAARDTSTHDA